MCELASFYSLCTSDWSFRPVPESTQKPRPGHCFLLSVPCHSRSRKRFALPSSFVAGFAVLQYHGWDMDAPAERMGSGWTLSWSGHGCSGRTDGVWVGAIMVGTRMLWQNRWGLGGLERMGSGWTLSWLGHGCSGRTDGVWVDVIIVGTRMLWQNGWGLGGRYHGRDMDALAERMGSGRSGWTLSWLGHGCSAAKRKYVHTYIHIRTKLKHTYTCILVCVEPKAARKSDLGRRRGRGGKKGWANDQVRAKNQNT